MRKRGSDGTAAGRPRVQVPGMAAGTARCRLQAPEIPVSRSGFLRKAVAASFVVAALMLAGLALRAQVSGGASLPDNPLAGRALFERKLCIQCHGIAGRGPSIGPNLGEGHFRGTFLELGVALWNHAPAMSATFEVSGLPWPQLTHQEATELMVFLYFIDYLGRPGDAAAGRATFERGGCSQCHVIGGGRAKLGPDLVGLSRYASPLYIAQEIWNHGPSMFESMRALHMNPPSFADGDLADLSAFIRREAGPAPRQPLLSAAGNPNRGSQLFASKGCSSCHGPGGRGGRGGPDLTLFELHRPAEAIAGLMWNHALAMDTAMRERGIGWPRFENSDLADLVAFLYFLPFADPPGDPARGAEVFAQRSCAECHAAPESAPHAGPDLVETGVGESSEAFVAAMWSHAPFMKEAILGEGKPWPELTGENLRDLLAYLRGYDRRP